MSSSPQKRVAVVGGGVVGVCSALRVAEKLGARASVTLISDSFSPHTTGDGSAGFVWPYLLGSTPPETVRRWCRSTFDLLKDLLRSAMADKCGVGLLSSYHLYTENQVHPSYSDVFPGFRSMTAGELELFPSEYKYGVFFTTFYVECTRLLPVLMKRFERKGGRIIQQKINSFEELSRRFDLVVNCTGLGAGRLTGDSTLQPIRGQVIRVRAPWIKHAVSTEDFYILPNMDEVILGGTHQEGDYNLSLDSDDRDRIWNGCTRIMPSLAAAEVTCEWVGLRPGRPTPRVELETLLTRNGPLQVVHNYGHGGSGVTIAWGCAEDVVALVEAALSAAPKAHM